MKGIRYLAVAAGMILLLSGVLGNANALRAQPTTITLDIPSSAVSLNDVVTFAGALTYSKTGEGVRDKTVIIYREGPMTPVAIAEAFTGIDGGFSTTWTATMDMNRNTPVTVWAQFDGDDTAMPSRTGKATFKVALIPLNLEITTDGNKNRYTVGKSVLFSVAFHDGMGNFVDPDVIKATYDGNFVSLNNVDVGRYTFETPRLVKFEQHQFGVFVEKLGYTSTQKSLTITAFGAIIAKPVKVTASNVGDSIMIRVKNNVLSPGDVYTFKGKFLGASPVEGSSNSWSFNVDSANSFTFKSLEQSMQPGKFTSFKVNVDGTPTKLLWTAFDLHGKELASGATIVRTIRAM
jgi:hypothetical protein